MIVLFNYQKIYLPIVCNFFLNNSIDDGQPHKFKKT